MALLSFTFFLSTVYTCITQYTSTMLKCYVTVYFLLKRPRVSQFTSVEYLRYIYFSFNIIGEQYVLRLTC